MAALMLLAAVGGCSVEIPIYQYPPFWTPELKSIAVMPFRWEDKEIGRAFAEELTNALRYNQTYKVFSPQEVSDMAKMQDMQIAFGDDETAMAAQVRKIKSLKVQAILTGRVTAYSKTSRNEQKAEPVMIWDNYRKQYVPSGQYNYWTFTHNEGNVGATAALVSMEGKTFYATPTPAGYRQWSESTQYAAPPMDPGACRSAATTAVVQQLVEHFAVVRKTVKVDPDKTLLLATSYYDGKWDTAKSFSRGDRKMTVVLCLPPNCDRNNFRIAIVKGDKREDVASVDVLWSSKFPCNGKGFEFSPAELAQKAGTGQFSAKLYSGLDDKPVLAREFVIE